MFMQTCIGTERTQPCLGSHTHSFSFINISSYQTGVRLSSLVRTFGSAFSEELKLPVG